MVNTEEVVMSTGGAWRGVMKTDDLPQGETTCVEVAGLQIAIYNVEGAYFATDDICPHADAKLSEGWLDGHEIECPLHAARFDVRTGQVLSSPAACDLKTFPVRANGAEIEIWLDEVSSE